MLTVDHHTFRMRNYKRLLAGSLIACWACSSVTELPATQPPGPFSSVQISSDYSIAASVVTVSGPDAAIRYVLHITNGSDADEQVGYGACWAGLRFYQSPARTGAPVYDYGDAKAGYACTANWNETTVPARGSTDLVGGVSMSTLAAAKVAPGHYYVSLVVTVNGSTTQIAAGEVDVLP